MTSAHNFTQNPHEPDWQIPLEVRATEKGWNSPR